MNPLYLTSNATKQAMIVNAEAILYIESVGPGGIPIIGEKPPAPVSRIALRGGSAIAVKESIAEIIQKF